MQTLLRVTFALQGSLLLLLVGPFKVFAHEAEDPHVEPAEISPLIAVVAVAMIAGGGYLLWRFVLKGKPTEIKTDTT